MEIRARENRELGAHGDSDDFGRHSWSHPTWKCNEKHIFIDGDTNFARRYSIELLLITQHFPIVGFDPQPIFMTESNWFLSLLVSLWTHCLVDSFSFDARSCYRNQLTLIKIDNWCYWLDGMVRFRVGKLDSFVIFQMPNRWTISKGRIAVCEKINYISPIVGFWRENISPKSFSSLNCSDRKSSTENVKGITMRLKSVALASFRYTKVERKHHAHYEAISHRIGNWAAARAHTQIVPQQIEWTFIFSRWRFAFSEAYEIFLFHWHTLLDYKRIKRSTKKKRALQSLLLFNVSAIQSDKATTSVVINTWRVKVQLRQQKSCCVQLTAELSISWQWDDVDRELKRSFIHKLQITSIDERREINFREGMSWVIVWFIKSELSDCGEKLDWSLNVKKFHSIQMFEGSRNLISTWAINLNESQWSSNNT